MISKVIHYCWFGNQKMGEIEVDCINSWKKFLPSFHFQFWNENSIDLKQYPFAWQAFQSGKYAFVSDVVRLHVLYQEGGIYLDTDVLVIKGFDDLLNQDFFVGEYQIGALNAAVIGSIAGHPLLKELLDFYKQQTFEFLSPLTIPEVFDQLIWKYPLSNGTIYSPEYFYPLPLGRTDEDFSFFLTDNSYCVHLWNHSWKDEFVLLKENRFLGSFTLVLRHLISYPKTYRNVSYLKRYFTSFFRNLKRYGREKVFGNE